MTRTARDLLGRLAVAGVTITVDEAHNLRLNSEKPPPADLLVEARAMKAELMALLHAEAANDQADPLDAAEAAAIICTDYAAPPPGQPWHIVDYQRHKRHLAGLQAAALQRPPSWSGADALPGAGAWCLCCRGEVFELAASGTGWCCTRCHPAPRRMSP